MVQTKKGLLPRYPVVLVPNLRKLQLFHNDNDMRLMWYDEHPPKRMITFAFICVLHNFTALLESVLVVSNAKEAINLVQQV